jgi:hypothetical protein
MDSMDSRTNDQQQQQQQPLCLNSLTGSPEERRSAERRLSGEHGRQPSLYELVEDLMSRRGLATSFTGRDRRTNDDRRA